MSISYGGDSVNFADGSSLASGRMGMVNRIINGDMRIDQRNAGASITPTGGVYTIDRFYAQVSQASKFSVQQNAGSVTPPAGFTKYLGITSSSSYGSAAGDYFFVAQNIEGYNISDLGWGSANAKTITLSFWVRSSLTGTFGGSLCNGDSSRSYPFSYTISSANTWEQKSITIAGDTSGTWNTTNSSGICVNLNLGCGATYSGTAGTWASGLYLNATGATSVVGTSGATFYITGVDLRAGTYATAPTWEFRSYQQELALSQRYYEQGGVSERRYISNANGMHTGCRVDFKEEKRAVPTISLANGYTYDGWTNYSIESHDNPGGATNKIKSFTVDCTANQTNNGGAVVACTWTASAEL